MGIKKLSFNALRAMTKPLLRKKETLGRKTPMPTRERTRGGKKVYLFPLSTLRPTHFGQATYKKSTERPDNIRGKKLSLRMKHLLYGRVSTAVGPGSLARKVDKMTFDIKKGDKLPPIFVGPAGSEPYVAKGLTKVLKSKKFDILDGHHRRLAHIRLGKRWIKGKRLDEVKLPLKTFRGLILKRKHPPKIKPVNPVEIKDGSILFGGEVVGAINIVSSSRKKESFMKLWSDDIALSPDISETLKRSIFNLPDRFDYHYIHGLEVQANKRSGWIGSLTLQTFFRDKVKAPAVVALLVDSGSKRPEALRRFYKDNGFELFKSGYNTYAIRVFD